MTRLQIYRRWLIVTLAIALLFLGYSFLNYMRYIIPDTIMIKTGEGFTNDFKLCSVYIDSKAVETKQNDVISVVDNKVNISENISNYTFKTVGTYNAKYKLLGFIELKDVKINVVDNKKLIPCGFPVGIYVETEGIMIIGTGKVCGLDRNEYAPAENIVKGGDYVTSINDEKVSCKEEFLEKINQYGAKEVILGIKRNGENLKVKIKPVQTAADEYKLGIWIRDNTQGIGMITYIDEEGKYGALGHGISDVDTGLLMNVKNGTLFQTEIMSIVKGEKGKPGELIGMIDYDDNRRVGTISKNTEYGIFGEISKVPYYVNDIEPLEIATKEQIKEGNAKVQTCLDGEVKQYDIEIQEKNLSDRGNKGIIFRITDEELIRKTGGVIQGLSGSPIIQDGKIIGAVTHVFVNDPTRGYGIFIENMLEH